MLRPSIVGGAPWPNGKGMGPGQALGAAGAVSPAGLHEARQARRGTHHFVITLKDERGSTTTGTRR